jgi:hypothetical protein
MGGFSATVRKQFLCTLLNSRPAVALVPTTVFTRGKLHNPLETNTTVKIAVWLLWHALLDQLRDGRR